MRFVVQVGSCHNRESYSAAGECNTSSNIINAEAKRIWQIPVPLVDHSLYLRILLLVVPEKGLSWEEYSVCSGGEGQG